MLSFFLPFNIFTNTPMLQGVLALVAAITTAEAIRQTVKGEEFAANTWIAALIILIIFTIMVYYADETGHFKIQTPKVQS